MTHKHTKSNRYGKTRNVNNEASFIVVSKPLLLSSEDEESLAIHSARARMVLQSKKTRFLRKYTHIGENISIINGTAYHINPVTASIIPTYQASIHNVRWNERIMETCMEEPQFNARRENCMYEEKECIEPYLQARNIMLENKKKSFKDNIVRYTDNSTMTWTMNDVGCGVDNPVLQNLTLKDSSYAVTSKVHQLPIFETSGYETNVFNSDKIDDNANLTSNNYDDYKELSKLNVKMPQDTVPHAHSQFKRFPKLSTKMFSMTKLSKISNSLAERCKMSIPHTHRVHSKYHCGCASVSSSHNVNDSVKRQNSSNNPSLIQCKRIPSIRLPKRVVASERDVHVFIEKR